MFHARRKITHADKLSASESLPSSISVRVISCVCMCVCVVCARDWREGRSEKVVRNFEIISISVITRLRADRQDTLSKKTTRHKHDTTQSKDGSNSKEQGHVDARRARGFPQRPTATRVEQPRLGTGGANTFCTLNQDTLPKVSLL
ncbi:unnamed protein product [Ectocarpus sp. 4 AP-2014]|uniref:EsV-1-195 n=1 Tax=Ectocarpus siliculosus virus 1 (isolate New Zealand/Kaikoura/1988) TaxID=654926 RepID=Q8QN94_ESV1K|nr:EsV-1-195 [Ectocarpus siliculosus virus 1]AAK14609.1 EsV-1-195 [Ectocarpus siliculosus virus 1]